MEFQQWDTLVYGIERGECILFLGPQLPLLSPEGKRIVPSEELTRRHDPKQSWHFDFVGIFIAPAKHLWKSLGLSIN